MRGEGWRLERVRVPHRGRMRLVAGAPVPDPLQWLAEGVPTHAR